MKKQLSWLPILLFFAAAGLMFAADRLAMPVLTFAGLVLLGLCAVVSGIQVMVTRQAFFLPSGRDSYARRAESYSGLAAQLWGVMFIMFGLIFTGIGLIGIGSPNQVFSYLEQALETSTGWGVLLLVIGVFVTLYAVTRILAGGASTGSGLGFRWRDLGYRFFGVAALIIGLLLLALGYLLLASPEIFNGLVQQWIPVTP